MQANPVPLGRDAYWEAEFRRAFERIEGFRTEAREVAAIAAAYPPEAASTPRSERERYFTAAQRVAWEVRFGTREHLDAEFVRLVDMHL